MSAQRRRAPRRHVFRPRRWALLLLFTAGLAVAYDLFLPAGAFPPDERRVTGLQGWLYSTHHQNCTRAIHCNRRGKPPT